MDCDNPYCGVTICSFWIGDFYDGVEFSFCSVDCWSEYDRIDR